jgi:hypothetical protein
MAQHFSVVDLHVKHQTTVTAQQVVAACGSSLAQEPASAGRLQEPAGAKQKME